MLQRLRSIVVALVGRRRFEADMAEELRFHLDRYVEELRRAGVPPEEAARRARREFGSLDNVKDDCREARGLRVFDDLVRDLRHAIRRLARAPAFTASAVATIALCLAANLAIFAFVDQILLRPLPFPQPDRLVRVFNSYPKAGVMDDGASVTNYYERRGRIPALSAMAIYRPASAIVGEPGATEREAVLRVSADFFATLGVGPAMGRAFGDREMAPGADRVVIVTDAYWRRRLNADPAAIGRTIRIDGVPMTLVGVLPPAFRFLSSDARLYVPLSSSPDERGPAGRHSGSSTNMVARLGPGAMIADAEAELAAQNAALADSYPGAKIIRESGFHTVVVSLHGDHVAAVRPALVLLQTGALVLLLIGAVNLVSLLLVRASARQKELAVRQALGASRRHVVSAVLRRGRATPRDRVALGATPHQVRAGFFSLAGRLVAAGTALGLAGAWVAGHQMRALLFGVRPADVRIFAAAALVTGGVALVACLIPSRRAARVSPIEALSGE